MPRSVMWFRRDLRLADHPALAAAAAHGDVVPLYVIDPLFTRRAGAPRRAFLRGALAALREATGGALVVRTGDPSRVVSAFAAEVGADTVHVTKDHAPYGRRRDAEVSEALRADDRRLSGVGSPYAVEPGTIAKQDGTGYAVYSPFARAWRTAGWKHPIDTPEVCWAGHPQVPSDPLPEAPAVDIAVPAGTEAEWHGRWSTFADEHLDRYAEQRNVPGDPEGTSRMSIALRWGVLHPRQLLDELGHSRSHDKFRSELAWRDFYADVLFRRPESAWAPLQQKMRDMPVDTDADARRRLRIWQEGRTGFPIVDAGMRQLLGTGWMHNRLRMITASFLVKDLHLPWQWGAKHFFAHLLDADLASNNHGWQWVAGTGTDPSPFFRVFNPTVQGEKFDPHGTYIRRWVPELADAADAQLHAPSGGHTDGYPPAMVDHRVEREEALRRHRLVPPPSR